MGEFKKFDSLDTYLLRGARLAKDAEVREGEHGLMVRLTFASESRNEAHDTLWIEANVGDFNAQIASFLKKGDILHAVEGKPCLRRFGDNNEKFSFVVNRCTIAVPIELFATLKERGFTPGQKGGGAKKSTPTPSKKPAPAKKPAPSKKPTPIEIPDDPDDDLEIEDSDDE